MMNDTKSYGLYINGEFVESTGGEHIDVECPYDSTVWATVPAGTTADIDRAVGAARDAFETTWKVADPSEPSAILHEIADVVDEHTEEHGRLKTQQNGKLIREMERQIDIRVERLVPLLC